MRKNYKVLSVSGMGLLLSVAAFAGEYEIDTGHSSVSFKIRHLVSKTTGSFNKFEGKIQFEPGKLAAAKVETKIDAESINTNEAKRDEHLRSPDFFDVKKHPELTFKSTGVTNVRGNKAKLKGDLTIHGVTKPVVLDMEYTGAGTDPWGNKKVGFTATTKLNRKDFGLTWNKVLDTGGFVVGDDVEISLEIEANAKKSG